jgi:hypothetical protein
MECWPPSECLNRDQMYQRELCPCSQIDVGVEGDFVVLGFGFQV